MLMINSRLLKITSFGAGCLVVGVYIGYKLVKTKRTQSENEILIQKTYERLPHLDRQIDEYVIETSLREPKPLADLRQMTLERFPGEPMIIDPVEAQLFQLLIKSLDARNCMEVGAFTGYNAANMALALPKNDGKVVVCDVTDEYLNAGRSYIEQLGPEIWSMFDVHIKKAFETMDHFINAGEEFDFIFLDAEWKTCMTYYEKALKLIRKGGIIGIDNTLCSGRVAQPLNKIKDEELRDEVKSLHEMNIFIKTDPRVEIVLLKIADGVTLCRKI